MARLASLYRVSWIISACTINLVSMNTAALRIYKSDFMTMMARRLVRVDRIVEALRKLGMGFKSTEASHFGRGSQVGRGSQAHTGSQFCVGFATLLRISDSRWLPRFPFCQKLARDCQDITWVWARIAGPGFSLSGRLSNQISLRKLSRSISGSAPHPIPSDHLPYRSSRG